jgi:hypothetical protein
MGICVIKIDGWLGKQSSVSNQMLKYSAVHVSGSIPVIVYPFADLSYRISLWNMRRRMNPQSRAQAVYLGELLKRRRSLDRQRGSLAQARRMIALWHTLHVPIGLALFTAALIHIGAAIYYATLLR